MFSDTSTLLFCYSALSMLFFFHLSAGSKPVLVLEVIDLDFYLRCTKFCSRTLFGCDEAFMSFVSHPHVQIDRFCLYSSIFCLCWNVRSEWQAGITWVAEGCRCSSFAEVCWHSLVVVSITALPSSRTFFLVLSISMVCFLRTIDALVFSGSLDFFSAGAGSSLSAAVVSAGSCFSCSCTMNILSFVLRQEQSASFCSIVSGAFFLRSSLMIFLPTFVVRDFCYGVLGLLSTDFRAQEQRLPRPGAESWLVWQRLHLVLYWTLCRSLCQLAVCLLRWLSFRAVLLTGSPFCGWL